MTQHADERIHKQSDTSFQHLARSVTILTHATDALLTITDEQTLLRTICQIAVEQAGCPLAWVGYAGASAANGLTPIAAAGKALAYLDNLHISWDESQWGQGPIGTAIRTGQTQLMVDAPNDPKFAPWRQRALQYGLRSVCALPLGPPGAVLGALTIYGDEQDQLDPQSVQLMEHLARNLTFGIGALRLRAGHDIAVRQQAESEERYRSLVELSPDAIIVHSKGRVLFTNSTARQMFAPSGQSLTGINILLLFQEQSVKAAKLALQQPPHDRELTDYRMCDLNGRAFDAEVVATTITFHDLPARILVIRDVTVRNQMNEQLIQAAKLATLGEMAAGLVHELSQPLNVIRLSAEGALLFMERGKATPEWQAQQFQQIADQTQRAAEIIDDIRIFSRRDTSPVQIFDAVAITRGAVAVLENQMRPDGIHLTLDFPTHAIAIKGRPVHLEQVILNLVTNAHHALKELPPPTGNSPPPTITVAARRRGHHLCITVGDNGPGIPPQVRPHIFEPFFTTKEAGRGTGLGLSISFGIITGMAGRLEIMDQDQSQGACFCITLPIERQALADPADAPPPSPAPPSITMDAHLMVVEDDRTAGEALAENLRAMGCRVTVCANGTLAHDIFMKDPADVVITDLRMPAGGGEQLVEKLRDFDPLLPIIIVTGHLGATERLAENLQDDRCAVLKKPLALSKLREIIGQFLLPPSE